MDLSELLRQQHGLRVERLPDGRHHIMVEPHRGCAGARSSWTTAYPPELILEIHNDENLLAAQQSDLQSLESQLQSTNTQLKTHQDDLNAKLAAQQKLMDGMNKDKTSAQALVDKLLNWEFAAKNLG